MSQAGRNTLVLGGEKSIWFVGQEIPFLDILPPTKEAATLGYDQHPD